MKREFTLRNGPDLSLVCPPLPVSTTRAALLCRRAGDYFIALGVIFLLAAAISLFPPRPHLPAFPVASIAASGMTRMHDGMEWGEENSLRRFQRSIAAGAEFDLDAATRRVYLGTVHSDRRRVSVQENWIQYLLGQIYEPLLHTQNTRLLIDAGMANCSERSQILKSFCESAGWRCRFVGLTGHVFLEVKDQGVWRVLDPDYGVTFPVGLSELEEPGGESLIRDRLSSARYSDDVIDNYVSIVQSTADNVTLPEGQPLSPRLDAVEQACAATIWILPAGCLALGIVFSRFGQRRRSIA